MSKNISSCLSSNSDEWATPKYIYDQAVKLGMFDPCPLGGSVDGLSIEWGDLTFVNPPYSQLKRWVDKSIEQAKKGKHVILLIPARTDTKAFKALWEFGAHFTFIHGRLRFNDKGSAPFPSMLVRVFGSGYSTCSLVDRERVVL